MLPTIVFGFQLLVICYLDSLHHEKFLIRNELGGFHVHGVC